MFKSQMRSFKDEGKDNLEALQLKIIFELLLFGSSRHIDNHQLILLKLNHQKIHVDCYILRLEQSKHKMAQYGS